MLEVIIFILLIICIVGLVFMEIVFFIHWIIKNYKKSTTVKQIKRMKKAVILLSTSVVLCIGLMGYSQITTRTPAILDENGNIVKNSIAKLEKVNIHGREEWISIRGHDIKNPIVLFLAGGPGGSQLAAVRHELAELEKHFTVVVWDQPGSGKSYEIKDDITVDTYIEDGIELTKYLCDEFNQKKIYLLGESWGSALAIFLASNASQYYHAIVGTGQMIAFLETEQMDYDKAIEIAKEKGDINKIEILKENGRPPYFGEDVTWKSAEYLNYLSSYMTKNPKIHNSGYNTFRDLFSIEYSLLDKINYLRGIVTTFNHVYPQLYEIDLRVDYPTLEVPVYFFLGRHDINAPTSLVEDYYSILEAPYKKIVWFENSGHSPWINESDKFVNEMLSIIKSQ